MCFSVIEFIFAAAIALLALQSPAVLVSALPSHLHRRHTTQNCQLSTALPSQIRELNSHLNTSLLLTSLERSLTTTGGHNVPQSPQMTCLQANSVAETSSESNLRATCPWVNTMKDMGDNIYPRYIPEARCLCPLCRNQTTYGCEELRLPVTVFQKVACQDGLAVMKKEVRTITVGCLCTRPAVASLTTFL